MENLGHLVSRMPLYEGEENQPSSCHMLEVSLEAVAVGKDVNNRIEEEEKIVGDVASQKVNRKGKGFEAINPEQHEKKYELQINPKIWNNRRLDVLFKELCDSGRGFSTA